MLGFSLAVTFRIVISCSSVYVINVNQINLNTKCSYVVYWIFQKEVTICLTLKYQENKFKRIGNDFKCDKWGMFVL